jgi:hypothetical protein
MKKLKKIWKGLIVLSIITIVWSAMVINQPIYSPWVKYSPMGYWTYNIEEFAKQTPLTTELDREVFLVILMTETTPKFWMWDSHFADHPSWDALRKEFKEAYLAKFL